MSENAINTSAQDGFWVDYNEENDKKYDMFSRSGFKTREEFDEAIVASRAANGSLPQMWIANEVSESDSEPSDN